MGRNDYLHQVKNLTLISILWFLFPFKLSRDGEEQQLAEYLAEYPTEYPAYITKDGVKIDLLDSNKNSALHYACRYVKTQVKEHTIPDLVFRFFY